MSVKCVEAGGGHEFPDIRIVAPTVDVDIGESVRE